MNGKWGLEWDYGCFLSYEVAEMSMKEREKYTKHPKDYRLVMYISQKPYGEYFIFLYESRRTRQG
jgi:hypothetical protein